MELSFLDDSDVRLDCECVILSIVAGRKNTVHGFSSSMAARPVVSETVRSGASRLLLAGLSAIRISVFFRTWRTIRLNLHICPNSGWAC